ncbi:uncharacterized protein BBOV_IV007420 [Babesia bovis T2Bo]|uniref:Membrane protein, putative n=1 Tax=Babesia bovis TaxID=5865 RepID=A7ARC9_BABBO|nr:uncharacterized protein BBOV_IV007420 [Babesia bovis T2Bo]EDO07099.1 putative integral membrane protein [Babesia bovis T2Bo]|eukprot:XP_001610667.1 hypothetical protein [Babesia bovis T2Bo]
MAICRYTPEGTLRIIRLSLVWMTKFLILIIIWCSSIVECSRIGLQTFGLRGVKPLAALGGSGIKERTFQRRWKLSSDFLPHLDDSIRRELDALLKKECTNKNDTTNLTCNLYSEVERIKNILLPRNVEVYLTKYYSIKLIKHNSFLGDFIEWLFGTKEYITYTAWQYRPNILYKGGNLTLEIHYKIPINVQGGKEILFESIIVYNCDVTPGRYIEGTAIFNSGTIQLLTHPILPWKKIDVGTFSMLASSQPTVFM